MFFLRYLTKSLPCEARQYTSRTCSNLLDLHTYRYARPQPGPVPCLRRKGRLRYDAGHDSLVMATFSSLFLLKITNLFPAELDLGAITV